MIKKILVLVLFSILGIMLHNFLKDYEKVTSSVDNAIFRTSSPIQKMVGGDKDEHGCIGAAGYIWCESKSRCINVSEESCSKK